MKNVCRDVRDGERERVVVSSALRAAPSTPRAASRRGRRHGVDVRRERARGRGGAVVARARERRGAVRARERSRATTATASSTPAPATATPRLVRGVAAADRPAARRRDRVAAHPRVSVRLPRRARGASVDLLATRRRRPSRATDALTSRASSRRLTPPPPPPPPSSLRRSSDEHLARAPGPARGGQDDDAPARAPPQRPGVDARRRIRRRYSWRRLDRPLGTAPPRRARGGASHGVHPQRARRRDRGIPRPVRLEDVLENARGGGHRGRVHAAAAGRPESPGRLRRVLIHTGSHTTPSAW